MQYTTRNGWTIEFRIVGIWACRLRLDPAELSDLLEGLREWADQSGLKYRLYKTREDYETNSGSRRIMAHVMFCALVAVVSFFGLRTAR